MSEHAIEVEGLGKRYRIGLRGAQANSFRDLVSNTVTAPVRRLRALREKATEADTFWAVRDVSFQVQRGEVLGIVGKNGAGKSTLLKLLSRITEPTEGRAVFRGRVASLLEVGTGFHPELSGRENIYLNGSILGMRKAEISSKFDQIVDFAEVGKFLDTPVKRYSSGMYVRLAFAVAAHLEPEILVVDEVLAVGDVQFQQKCLGKMQEVSKGEGRTVLFVSHQMNSVRQLCNRALFLEGGRVKAIGQAGEVVDQYLQRAAEQDRMVYDLPPDRRPPPYCTAQALMQSLSFDPPTSKRFFHDQPISFRMTVRGVEEVEDFRVACVVRSVQGHSIGTMFSKPVFSVAPGREATFQVEIPPMGLIPGTYDLLVTIGRGNPSIGTREIDEVRDVLHFDVVPAPVDGGAVERWMPLWGSIRLPTPAVTAVE